MEAQPLDKRSLFSLHVKRSIACERRPQSKTLNKYHSGHDWHDRVCLKHTEMMELSEELDGGNVVGPMFWSAKSNRPIHALSRSVDHVSFTLRPASSSTEIYEIPGGAVAWTTPADTLSSQ